MRRVGEFAVLIALSFGFSSVANACVCPTVGQPLESVKAYYGKSFEGAVFTGTITAIRDVPSAGTEEFPHSLTELAIEIDQYWIGVDKPTIKVYTTGPGTSCSVDWEIGQTRFFIASRDKINKKNLNVGMCSLSNWRGKYPNKEWADYTTEILGPSRSFGKKDDVSKPNIGQ